uniref:Hexosyltransferase n=1 Tax=Globodera pallida TaxID=36090 RepID=A0A183CIA5_GLOPA
MTTSASPSSSSTAASSPASASNAAPSSASSSSSCYFSSSSSALRIFSSSSSSSGTSPRPDECHNQRRPNDHLQCSSHGRRAKFMASPCCLINLERADEKSSSCPSLAALFSREENPSGGSSIRPSSASPTHQRKISNHQNRNRQKRNQHQKQRDRRTEADEDKSTTNSSSSKSAKSRRSSSASLWPSIVSQWRSRVGGAGLVLLLLQFLWVPPYLCFANYLERCLLPLRVYCYTAPDFLAVRVPLRDGPAACAAHFFANNAAQWAQRQTKRVLSPTGSTCSLNGTLPVLLRPWHAIVDNESSIQRVIVIRSAPRAAEYRKYIRDSWKPAVEKLNGPVVFVAGRDGTDLAAENGEHGDILQLDFEDSYRNLTLKMMGLYPWLPWHVDSELYPHKCYPPFVQGSSFVISRAAAAEVLRHVCDFAGYAIHLDDILMGLLTNCLGIPNIHRDGFDVGHSLESFTVFHYQFSRYSSLTLAEMFGRVKHLL